MDDRAINIEPIVNGSPLLQLHASLCHPMLRLDDVFPSCEEQERDPVHPLVIGQQSSAQIGYGSPTLALKA